MDIRKTGTWTAAVLALHVTFSGLDVAAAQAQDTPAGAAAGGIIASAAPATGAWAGHGLLVRDLAGREIGAGISPLDLGPQYPLGNGAAIGGELEHFQPLHIDARPPYEHYTFGLHLSF